MSEIGNILITKINYSTAEVNRSSPNLNSKAANEDSDINIYQVPKVRGDDGTQSISKSQDIISTKSMQDTRLPLITSDTTAVVASQPETQNDAVSLSASFKQLSRRESSLENLAEDDNEPHCKSASPDYSVSTFVQKPDPNDLLRKSESSSRFRRTMHSLFSCCSAKSRRSVFVAKLECTLDGETVSVSDRLCSNQTCQRGNKDSNHVSLNCLRLRKFFDLLDESESVVKRVQPSHQSLPLVPYRDGDKIDPASSRKAADIPPQSENGGANLTYSGNGFAHAHIVPESESLLNVASFCSARPVLLGPLKLADQGKKCFIIDLDETLVHSSFKMVDKADFKVGVDIEGTVHMVYVLKRPHVDVFLQKMGRIFECVLFTASLAKYADPVTDFLDKWRVFRWRLFRESCVFHRGNYVKDLSMLGRLTNQVVILDNSPASYMFHPDSAVQITSWFDDPKDTALLDLIPYFEQLAQAPSVPPFLATVKPPPKATVPISVMLPLPPPVASSKMPLGSLPPLSSSSSSPITSVVPSVAMVANLLPAVRAPVDHPPAVPFDDLRLPFSRGLAKSLTSLPLSTSSSSSSSFLRQPSFLRPSRSDTTLTARLTPLARPHYPHGQGVSRSHPTLATLSLATTSRSRSAPSVVDPAARISWTRVIPKWRSLPDVPAIVGLQRALARSHSHH